MAHTMGTGAIKDTYDIRDYHYEAPPKGAFNWVEGFDIEKKIGTKLVTKDQNGSFSCGGQAWAYYMEVLEAVATGTYEPRSARWIYSHTNVQPGGGSHGRDNCDHVIKKGAVMEKHATSYDRGKPPRESFIIQKPTLTQEAKEDAEVTRALSYLQVAPNIDLFAEAIVANNGLVLAVNGQDNGTWRSKYPKPPTQKEWAHWLYAGKVRLIDGDKYIGVKNSWGDVGEDGWQWIGEDYFTTNNVWYGWTLAWDYKPAKTKVLLKELIRLYTLLLNSLKK